MMKKALYEAEPAPSFNEKKLFEEDLAAKNHVAKSQGIYLESGLIEA